MKNERDVKREVKRVLDEHKVYYFMPVQTGYGVAGIPDFVCCHRGRFLGIETKFGKNKQSAHQTKQEHDILRSGGTYLLVNESNIEYVEAWVRYVGGSVKE